MRNDSLGELLEKPLVRALAVIYVLWTFLPSGQKLYSKIAERPADLVAAQAINMSGNDATLLFWGQKGDVWEVLPSYRAEEPGRHYLPIAADGKAQVYAYSPARELEYDSLVVVALGSDGQAWRVDIAEAERALTVRSEVVERPELLESVDRSLEQRKFALTIIELIFNIVIVATGIFYAVCKRLGGKVPFVMGLICLLFSALILANIEELAYFYRYFNLLG